MWLLILLLATFSFASKFEVISGDRPVKINMMPNDKKAATMKCSPDKTFTFEKNGTVIAEVKNDSLKWNVPADISYFKVKGKMIHKSIIDGKAVEVIDWRLVSLDNFSDDDKHGWTGAETESKTCGPSKDKSLFRMCKTKTDFVEKKFTNLGQHTEVMVEMIVHFIDQWQGELAYLQIEKDIVWTKSHNWCHTIFNHRCVLNGVNVCEDAYPDLVGQNIKFVYKHSKPTLSVRFGTSLEKGNCNANWGFNNFMLYLR